MEGVDVGVGEAFGQEPSTPGADVGGPHRAELHRPERRPDPLELGLSLTHGRGPVAAVALQPGVGPFVDRRTGQPRIDVHAGHELAGLIVEPVLRVDLAGEVPGVLPTIVVAVVNPPLTARPLDDARHARVLPIRRSPSGRPPSSARPLPGSAGAARSGSTPAGLPAAYAAVYVQLGYAATVHTAHGMTVDTSHTVLAGATTARRGATDPAARLHDAAPYLRERAGLITALAERVALDTAASEDTSGWTNGLTPRLHGELAVWRAAHGIADTDPEPTGRHHDDDRGAGISATLTAASDAALTGHRAHRSTGPTTSLPGFFATQARCGPGSPNCRRPGADVPALIRQALAEPRALPAEDPADALWWRIVGADFAGS